MTIPPVALSPVQPTATDLVKRIVPWLVAVAFFMESLDTTILATAVPTLAHALNVAPLNMKSVLACYTLSLAVFIPISGWLADRFGTRQVFGSAIGLFTVSSFFCGLSQNVDMLVFFRVLQGCGGALMMPVGRIAMVRTFPKKELLKAMSFVVVPGLAGPMLGPLVGGLIVAHLHWSVIFFVNIPIGLAGLFLVYRFLPDYKSDKPVPLDLFGFIFFGSGIALLSYVLEVFGEHSLNGSEMAGLALVSLVLLAIYGARALKIPYPLLNLSLFKIRTFQSAVLGGFIARLGIGGFPFLFPLLFQIGLGYSSTISGLFLMPPAFAAMCLKSVSVWVLAKFGHRNILISNTVLLGLIMMVFSTIGADTPWWVIGSQTFCFGFFTSLQYTSMNSLVYADVSAEETSKASTIASTMQQMSFSFAVAIASLSTAFFVPDKVHATPPEMLLGIHKAFFVLGSLTILSSLVFLRIKADDGQAVSGYK